MKNTSHTRRSVLRLGALGTLGTLAACQTPVQTRIIPNPFAATAAGAQRSLCNKCHSKD